MGKNEVIEIMQNIFRDVFDDDALIISMSTSSSDIGNWDSLANISLIVAIEKEFDIKFNLKEIRSMKSVGDTIDLILNKI